MALKNGQYWQSLKDQKKRKRMEQIEQYFDAKKKTEIIETEATSTSPKKSLAIAIAGSIIDNVQTEELAANLIGQIARAAAIYKVDEIVVFDDTSSTVGEKSEGNKEESTTWQHCVWMANILQYLECPSYLRKHLFPLTRDYKFAGMLNPLNAPHHLRRDALSLYREGVVMEEVHTELKQSYVEVGLINKVRVDRELQPGLRVTVKLSTDGGNKGTVVSPREPKATLNTYWGYEVRVARTFSIVFTESPHKRGYNLTIGTSDKGEPLNDVTFRHKKKQRTLIVIGGLKGLEFAVSNDDTLKSQDINGIFDHYVNVCPDQGSNTIRSEEALLISLAMITNKLNNPV